MKTKTYFFFCLPTYGHIFPLLPIVDELIKNNNRVIFYGREDFKPIIMQTGCEFRPFSYPFKGFNAKSQGTSSWLDQILEKIWIQLPQWLAGLAGKNPLYLFHTVISSPRPAADILGGVKESMASIFEDIAKDQPDCIVEDSMSPFGRFLKGKTSIPAVVIWSSPNYSRMLWWPSGLLNILMRIKNFSLWNKFQTLTKSLAQEYNTKILSIDGLFYRNQGDLNIALVPEHWQPDIQEFDSNNCRWVGFCLPQAQIQDDSFPYDRLEQGKVIYISIGTVFNENLSFYQKCMAALGNTDYTVVMSYGDKLNIEQFGTIPDNFIVRKMVAQPKILAKADLFVTHCTTTNTAEILKYRTPALLHPQAYDQFLVAQIAHENGLGIFLEPNFSPEQLLAKIDYLMTNKQAFLDNIEKVRTGVLDGAVKAVECIEQLLEKSSEESAIK